jgi:membrane fusion protein (multidrug efflux system)
MTRNRIFNYTIIAGLSLAVACTNKEAPRQQMGGPVPVSVVEAQLSNAIYYDEYPATVVALNEVDLRPQVNGYITGIFFREGEKVTKGQKLYAIDAQQYTATYEQAVANLAVQKANLERAQKDVERYHELDKNDAISKQQVDNADAALEAAKRQVEAAQASVTAMQTNVRYTVITAPFDGTIGLSQVKLGTAVSAGQTLLNTISSDDPIAVDFAIDQSEIFRFMQLFEKNKSNKKDSTFRLIVNREGYSEYGYISVIDRAVDKQTGTIKVRLNFANSKKLLRSGMSVSVRVQSSPSDKSITIPFKAVTEQLGQFFVYTVGDSNKVTQQKVTLGKQIGHDIIVKEGVLPNQTIVVEGTQKLREGSVITTEGPTSPKK